jgi:hypothetical protein
MTGFSLIIGALDRRNRRGRRYALGVAGRHKVER